MSWSDARLILACAALSAIQVAWHWGISLNANLTQGFLRFYLSYNQVTEKGVAGWFDLVIPSITAGFLVGWLGSQWSNKKIFIYDLTCAFAITVLMLICASFFERSSVWWLPREGDELALRIFLKFIQSLVIVCVFSYGGRLLGAHFQNNP